MTTTYLPSVTWPANTVTPAGVLSAANSSIVKTQWQVGADNDVLALHFGLCNPGAQIACVLPYLGKWVVMAIWGEGEIDGFASITFDGQAMPAGVAVTHYTGTAGQAIDATLVAAWAANGVTYTDVLPGVAYSVFTLPASTASLPTINAQLRGLKLYDPRTGLTQYSTNPALALARVITDATFGWGKTVSWSDVTTVANACDEAMADGTLRRALNLSLTAAAGIETQVQLLMTYAGCWVYELGGVVHLAADRPASPVATYNYADTAPATLGKITNIKRNSLRDTPTAVCIRYTDTSTTPWSEIPGPVAYHPAVLAGTMPLRLQSIPMAGIIHRSQAAREAIERLNKYTLQDMSFSVPVYDIEVGRTLGDVVSVIDPVLGINLSARIMGTSGSLGRYLLQCVKYDVNCYSDHVESQQTTPDTTLPDASNPPAVTGLVVGEEVYQLKDGTWATRLRAYWTPPTWTYLSRANVRLMSAARIEDTQAINTLDTVTISGAYPGWNGPTLAAGTYNTYASGPVAEGAAYMLYVSLSCPAIGVAGAEASAAWTALGKQLPPSNVPSISARETGGTVRVTVAAAYDSDMSGYELRWGAAGVLWANATFCGFQNAASGVGAILATTDIPIGTWDVLCCALDTTGHYSTTPARCTVTVTSDSNTFLAGTATFTTPTVSNMTKWVVDPADGKTHYVTDDGRSVTTTFGATAASTFTDLWLNYHNSIASSFQTEVHDFGKSLSGNWSGSLDSSVLNTGGAKVDELLLSPDGSTYTSYGLNVKAAGRFSYMKSSTSGLDTLHVVVPTASVRIDANTLTRSGLITTSATAATPIILPDSYSACTSVVVSPIGQGALTGAPDRICLCPYSDFAGKSALQFDGVANYAGLATYAGIAVNTGTAEIMFWADTTPATNNRWIFNIHNAAAVVTDWWGIIITTAGKLRFQMGGNGGTASFNIDGTAGVCDGKWHRASVSFTPTTATLYLDGALVGTATLPSGTMAAPAGGYTAIGARGPFSGSGVYSQWGNIRLADARIFNTARTAGQIGANCWKPLTGTLPSDLKGYWPLDDATGTTARNAVTGGTVATLGGTTLPLWEGMSGFDAYVYNSSNAQIAQAANWSFSGV